jgi:hypothetical protein
VGVRFLHISSLFRLSPVGMSGQRPSRRSRFVLAGTGAPADAADDQLGGETGVATSFDGLTIVSSPDDEGSGWMGVAPPRHAVLERVRQPPRVFSGVLSAASSMTEPPTLRSSGPPLSRAGGVSQGGGEGIIGILTRIYTRNGRVTVSCDRLS